MSTWLCISRTGVVHAHGKCMCIVQHREVAAGALLLHDVSGGVQEMQCACERNGLSTLFPWPNMLRGAQRRRYANIAELIGNVNHFLLFKNGAWKFFWTYQSKEYEFLDAYDQFINGCVSESRTCVELYEKLALMESKFWNYDVHVFNIESTASYMYFSSKT